MSRKNKVKKKKTVGDHILTIVLIVAICIFCYAAFNLIIFIQNIKKEPMNITAFPKWQ